MRTLFLLAALTLGCSGDDDPVDTGEGVYTPVDGPNGASFVRLTCAPINGARRRRLCRR